MSDDTEVHSHQNIQHNGETYIKLADAAETFKSLRAWRVALYDALTEWHDPPRDDETPKAALRRLVHTEILAALDPAISRPAADLVATARRDALAEIKQDTDELIEQGRRDGMEEAAKWHDEQAAQAQKLADMKVSALDEKVWGDYATNHREYAAALRAAAKDDRERPLTHLDANDTRTFIINEGGDLVGLQDKSEKDREP